MGGLAGPVGLDAADRLGGGPPDGAGVLAEVDGDGLGGDVDGDDLPGVDAAESHLLPGDHDHAGVAGATSTPYLRTSLNRYPETRQSAPLLALPCREYQPKLRVPAPA